MRFTMIQAGDTVFLDTNVLLIATDAGRPEHEEANELFVNLPNRGVSLALSGQILREYLVVATRPKNKNGLGLRIRDALDNIREFRKRTVFREESEIVTDRLLGLLRAGRISGKRIHDANVAATMLAHQLRFLVTENPDDFTGFREIEVHRIQSIVNHCENLR